jgi:tetratricopeptide (TPR) repeat protein
MSVIVKIDAPDLAAIDSPTFVLGVIATASLGAVIAIIGVFLVLRFRMRRHPSLDVSLAAESPDALLAESHRLWTLDQHGRAFEAFMSAVRLDPGRADIWYEKARCECKDGLLEEAMRSLQEACELEGFYVILADKFDAEFKPLRTDPRFRELVNKRRKELKPIVTLHDEFFQYSIP